MIQRSKFGIQIRLIITELTVHKGQINCLKLFSNNKLASGSSDKTVKIWDIESGECLKTINLDAYILSNAQKIILANIKWEKINLSEFLFIFLFNIILIYN